MIANILKTWIVSLTSQMSQLASVFSDSLDEERAQKADAAFKKIREGLEDLRKVL